MMSPSNVMVSLTKMLGSACILLHDLGRRRVTELGLDLVFDIMPVQIIGSSFEIYAE